MTPQDHQNRPPKVSTPIANQDAIQSAPGHVSTVATIQRPVQYP